MLDLQCIVEGGIVVPVLGVGFPLVVVVLLCLLGFSPVVLVLPVLVIELLAPVLRQVLATAPAILSLEGLAFGEWIRRLWCGHGGAHFGGLSAHGINDLLEHSVVSGGLPFGHQVTDLQC